MAEVELIKTVSCPRLGEQEIPVEKCQACRYHEGINAKHGKVLCGFP